MRPPLHRSTNAVHDADARRVDMSEVFCRGCHMPATITEVAGRLLCEFCRIAATRTSKPRRSAWQRIRNWIVKERIGVGDNATLCGRDGHV